MHEKKLDAYTGHYFEHYLAMITGYKFNEEGIREFTNVYLKIEGKDTFCKLIDEINLIDENGDWDVFVSYMKMFAPSTDMATIQHIATVVKHVFENIA